MDNEFTGIPNDERMRRVCELIEGAIERSRLYRKSVLVPTPPSLPQPPSSLSHLYPTTSSCAIAAADVAANTITTTTATATTTSILSVSPDAASSPRRQSAPKRRHSPQRQGGSGGKYKKRLHSISEKDVSLPPLRDRLLRHMSSSVAATLSTSDRPLHSASMGNSRSPLRSRTSTDLSIRATSKELRSPTSNATPAPTSPYSDSKIKRADGKKTRWNPVPQATLMRAHIRAEAAERRAMQTFAEGPRRDTRRRLSEMLSWDPKNKCFLPPQATLMRALARQKRIEEQRASRMNASAPPSPLFPSRSQRSVSAASYLQRRRTRDVANEMTRRTGARSAMAGRRLGAAASGGGGVGGGGGGGSGGSGGSSAGGRAGQQQQQQAPGVDTATMAAARTVSLSAPVSLVVGLPPVLRRAVNASANETTRLSSPRQRPNLHRRGAALAAYL